MIFLFMEGGLGNQLFQYSAAKTLSKMRNNDQIVIDTSFYKNMSNRRYELNRFEIPEIHIADENCKNKLKYIIVRKIFSYYRENAFAWKGDLNKLVHKFIRFLLNTTGLYIDTRSDLIGFSMSEGMIKRKDIYLYGYFQYPQFINELELKLKVESIDLKTWKSCNVNSNHICVHIRLGDYVNNDYFGICKKRYYYDAMKYMIDNVSSPIFHVFSDDLNLVKQEFRFVVPVIYEEEENACECLKKMSMCKHFILSNSTFSWWAQRLATNREKIVVAPSYWYGDGNVKFYLYDKEWKLIKP